MRERLKKVLAGSEIVSKIESFAVLSIACLGLVVGTSGLYQEISNTSKVPTFDMVPTPPAGTEQPSYIFPSTTLPTAVTGTTTPEYIPTPNATR